MTAALTFLSVGSLSFFFGSVATEHVQWGPEQWSGLFIAILSSITAVVVTIIGNRRTAAVHEDIKLPSNSISAGELLEAMEQVQHIQANVVIAALTPPGKEPPEIPSAVTIARELRKMKDQQ